MPMTSVITASQIRAALKRHADPRHASILQRFFKTKPGEYGAGDTFIGIKMPQVRSVARAFRSAPLHTAIELLKSPIHEERLLALLLFVEQYDKGDEEQRATIYNVYLKQTKYINNWDLVDLSAPQIVGRHLETRDRSVLIRLSQSTSLWERRIGIMATFWFIKKGNFSDALMISEILLKDSNDLIHKAVGWMLREIGKRNITVEEEFLKRHYKDMPRTMLRYAIERFPENKRQDYLKGMM